MNLVEQLRRDEGVRLHPYVDTVGKITIGIGRNLTDIGISESEAELLLMNDIHKAEGDLMHTFPWVASMDEPRRAVLVNLTFNIGIGGLMTFHNTLNLIKSAQYDAAATEMLQSHWAKQVGERANRLSEQMRTGKWV